MNLVAIVSNPRYVISSSFIEMEVYQYLSGNKVGSLLGEIVPEYSPSGKYEGSTTAKKEPCVILQYLLPIYLRHLLPSC